MTVALAMIGTASAADYVVAIAEGADPAWSGVAEALAKVHEGEVVTYSGAAEDLLTPLKKHRPRFLAVVGAPEAFDAAFVRSLNRTARQVDEDPYMDVRWGLVTGDTPADAMRIVETREPLVIERALTTTGINLGLVESGLTLSDGARGDYTTKADGKISRLKWDKETDPDGTVDLFSKAWNETDPQVIVTSSHATQFNLEMPFGLGLIASYHGKFHLISEAQRNQFARFLGGAMFKGKPEEMGAWLTEIKAPVLKESAGPKVWVAAGNCLIGDARKTSDSMVVSAISAGGVRQFVGYVVPTWFGRAGWGTLGLWQGSGGRLSLAESFFLNDHKLIEETRTRFPGALEVVFDADDIETCMKTDRDFNAALVNLQTSGVKIEKDTLGLIHDRDVLAFWGDPAWEARFDPARGKPALKHEWKTVDGGLELVLEANADFEGEFPITLPERLAAAPMLDLPEGVEAVAGDDFLLIKKCSLKKGESRVIRLKAA